VSGTASTAPVAVLGGGSGGVDAHCIGVVQLYPLPEGDVVALRGVDLDIEAGEMLALLGPSGTGKSTLLRLLAGLLTPSAGKVRIGGHDVGKMSHRDRARMRATEVSYVVQDPSRNLLPYATAEENIWFAQRGARRYGGDMAYTPEKILDAVGVRAGRHQPVSTLSGGEQQRIAVAAGLSTGARLLLVDEPTSQLDTTERDAVVAVLQSVNEKLGATVVVVTHDPVVAGSTRRTVTIRDGRVGAEGRHGEEYAVVGRDGSVQLPPDVLTLLPPDSLVRIHRHPAGVDLRNPDLEAD
jgi:ABC-type lipoprotein export system ATPase subunit